MAITITDAEIVDDARTPKTAVRFQQTRKFVFTDSVGGPAQVITGADDVAGVYKVEAAIDLNISLRNDLGAPITWDVAPQVRGSNDPAIAPTATSGDDLASRLKGAFGAVLAANEEQIVTLLGGEAPARIWLVIDGPVQAIDLTTFITARRG